MDGCFDFFVSWDKDGKEEEEEEERDGEGGQEGW